MPPGRSLVAVAAGDRWLVAFILATLGVLAAGSYARQVARDAAQRARRGEAATTRGVRRRAGVLIALGPGIGFATSPTFGEHAWLIAGGAVALAALGTWAERQQDPDRLTAAMIGVAAATAVVAGVRFGPPGVR